MYWCSLCHVLTDAILSLRRDHDALPAFSKARMMEDELMRADRDHHVRDRRLSCGIAIDRHFRPRSGVNAERGFRIELERHCFPGLDLNPPLVPVSECLI